MAAQSVLLSVLKSLISPTLSVFFPFPAAHFSFPQIFGLSRHHRSLPLLSAPTPGSLCAFRGGPHGYLGRARCMLTSAPSFLFFFSSSFLPEAAAGNTSAPALVLHHPLLPRVRSLPPFVVVAVPAVLTCLHFQSVLVYLPQPNLCFSFLISLWRS